MTFSGGGGDEGQAGAHGEESETARASSPDSIASTTEPCCSSPSSTRPRTTTTGTVHLPASSASSAWRGFVALRMFFARFAANEPSSPTAWSW